MNKVLVVAVHPDDETLGCGGTLLKHKAKGDKIFWLIITCITEKDGFSKKQVLQREKEVKRVAKMYDFDNVIQLRIPTIKIDQIAQKTLIDKIAATFNKFEPDVVYLPFNFDIHSDHRIIFDAAWSCTKTFRYPFIKNIFMMETISETEFAPSLKEFTFRPNYFVDITDYLDKKLDIMKIYVNEIAEHPFPRSLENIKSIAIFRGAIVGCKYAESFMMLKGIM